MKPPIHADQHRYNNSIKGAKALRNFPTIYLWLYRVKE